MCNLGCGEIVITSTGTMVGIAIAKKGEIVVVSKMKNVLKQLDFKKEEE